MNYSRIFNNTASTGRSIYNGNGLINATNNWWGSNNPNFSNLIYGSATKTPYIMLKIGNKGDISVQVALHISYPI